MKGGRPMAYQDVRARNTGGHRVLHSESRRPVETIIANIVYFIFGVIITLLALRFVLLLLGANQDAGFTQLILGLSAPFMAPFVAVFGATQIEGSVFEWSALLAIAVYALLAWGIVALIDAVTPRASAGTVETVEEVHEDTAQEAAGDYGHDAYVDDRAGDSFVDEQGHRVHRGGGVVHR